MLPSDEANMWLDFPLFLSSLSLLSEFLSPEVECLVAHFEGEVFRALDDGDFLVFLLNVNIRIFHILLHNFTYIVTQIKILIVSRSAFRLSFIFLVFLSYVFYEYFKVRMCFKSFKCTHFVHYIFHL